MRSTRCGGGLWVAAGASYLVLEAVAAAGAARYSYAHDYISDLGLASSPRAFVLHAAFCLQAILFPLGAVLVTGPPRRWRAGVFVSLVALNGAGNVVIALVHRGPWHNAGAAAAIVGGNLGILVGARVIEATGGSHGYRRFSTVLAVLGLASLAVLLAGTPPAGAWERGSVYSITLWQLLSGTRLLRRGQPANLTGYR
jgi:hypothetical membrane protein